MDKKKVVFVVNPISGTNNKKYVINALPKIIDSSIIDWKLVYTEFPGHAAQIAKSAAQDGVDVVVAIGGDGTVNEVARSLTHTQTALGIIPCGSGNGLARHLMIPLDPIKALRTINECVIEDLDYGLINGIPFFCTCGVGFDAFVSSKFAAAGKRGLFTYLENTLREGLKYKPEKYEIEVDGLDGEKTHYDALLIACANASQYGNNVYIAPSASMSDGLMDVTIMEPFPIYEAPQVVLQLLNKTITSNSRIKTLKCKKLRIYRENPGVIHFDGDPVMAGKDISVELINNGLKVVVNSQASQSTSPLLRIFADFYNDVYNTVGDDLLQVNRSIRSINNDLLRKLKRM